VPIEVVVTRIITSQGRLKSWTEAAKEVLKEGGPSGLYKGIPAYVRKGREGKRQRGRREGGGKERRIFVFFKHRRAYDATPSATVSSSVPHPFPSSLPPSPPPSFPRVSCA
jgi:hypothetical protein